MDRVHSHTYVYHHRHDHAHLSEDCAVTAHDEPHPHGFTDAHDHGEHGARTAHSHKEKFAAPGAAEADHHDPVSHSFEPGAGNGAPGRVSGAPGTPA